MGQAYSQSVYWTDFSTGLLWRANLDGTGQLALVSVGLNVSPAGIALDLAGGQMYWSDVYGGDIRRANLDGSGETILLSGSTAPFDIALDLAGGQMYWSDGNGGDIWRAKLDGSKQTALVSGLDGPRGVVLDLAGGQMYFTDVFIGQILRSNLDGTGLQTLISGLNQPWHIALDFPGGKLYWSGGDIGRANLDGSGQEILIQKGGLGITLDLAHGKMYWTDGQGGGIQRANLDGSGQETLITGLQKPWGIALDLGVPGTAAYFALAAPASVPSGTSFDLTITALDPYGNTAVNYPGTVTFSTSDTDPDIVLPADYTFTAPDGGVHKFQGGVTLNTPGNQTITATDPASGITRSVTVAVMPPP
jgi:hypothetical protein